MSSSHNSSQINSSNEISQLKLPSYNAESKNTGLLLDDPYGINFKQIVNQIEPKSITLMKPEKTGAMLFDEIDNNLSQLDIKKKFEPLTPSIVSSNQDNNLNSIDKDLGIPIFNQQEKNKSFYPNLSEPKSDQSHSEIEAHLNKLSEFQLRKLLTTHNIKNDHLEKKDLIPVVFKYLPHDLLTINLKSNSSNQSFHVEISPPDSLTQTVKLYFRDYCEKDRSVVNRDVLIIILLQAITKLTEEQIKEKLKYYINNPDKNSFTELECIDLFKKLWENSK